MLEAFVQEQLEFPYACASFSAAMALNLLLGENYLMGEDMAVWLNTFLGTPPGLQDNIINLIISINGSEKYNANYSSNVTVDELIANLQKGYPTIVNISYGNSEVLHIPLGIEDGVGHAMVLVGYDPENNQMIFLNPLKEELDYWDMADFRGYYEQQPNLFIPAGSAVTLKPR